MRVFEITDYEYDPDIEREEGSTLLPFGVIRFSLQFIGLLLKVDVIIKEKTMFFSEYDFGFAGDSLGRDFEFDNKQDHDDFLHTILEKSQEIAGKTLMWEDWRDGNDDNDQFDTETINGPPPVGERKMVAA